VRAIARMRWRCLNFLPRCPRLITLFSLFMFLTGASAIHAQTPNPAASGLAPKAEQGFSPGWTLGTRFEGSSSGDGTIYDLGTAIGYNFTHHFAVDAGVPYYFVGTPSSITKKNPNAVSGAGWGNLFADLKLNYPGEALNYGSTIHLTVPNGDTKKGFSTGHATWNWSNHFEHALGNFTPYLDAGVGNTVVDSRFFHRPFTTFGYNAQFEGGVEFDAGRLRLTGSAYDVAPWGPQTVISRVFRCSAGAKCAANGKSTNRRGFTLASVQAGAADLVRDNGFNAGIDFKPVSRLDLEFDYSCSVPLQLNSFSFGIGVDLTWLLRPSTRRH
jgi:hypothetical protein